MNDEGHDTQIQSLVKALKVLVKVLVLVGKLWLVALAEPNEIRCNDTAILLEVRHDIAPDVRRFGVTMDENDWITGSSLLHVVDVVAVDLDVLGFITRTKGLARKLRCKFLCDLPRIFLVSHDANSAQVGYEKGK